MNHLSVKKHPVDERVAQVKLPRIEPSFDGELIQNPDFEHIFGSFRSADGVHPEGSLFSSVELVQEEARRRLKPGMGPKQRKPSLLSKQRLHEKRFQLQSWLFFLNKI